ncbi:hypothetical protein [Spirosoma spitsbergense]|uniref:hypothetical protein n=1 Tax=Spirosoma spitsbergense TaxID=431554 RepID=UPI00037224E3|nr:hypothetical protein [Spirosoma spitsbergense]
MNQQLLNQPPLPGLALVPRCLLALLPHKGIAQSHYLLNDGALETTLDEPRLILGAAWETTLTNKLVNSPGPLAVNLANNRSLVARVRNNTPGIVAIRLMTPYQVSS